MRHRPVLAGILFGLLTYKPQMGLLLPVALVAGRQWRVIAAAVVTLTLMAAAVTLAFGADIWVDWARAQTVQFDTYTQATNLAHKMPTVIAAMAVLGWPHWLGEACQALAFAASAAVVWACFRRQPYAELSAAALIAAGFLAIPYALVYDMPILGNAVLLILAERHRAQAPFAFGEPILLALVLALPVLLQIYNVLPCAPIVLAILLVLAARRCLRLTPARRMQSERGLRDVVPA